ncbi:MAG: response regulator transcription factor [Candidatus Cryptobacteroides sp.]|jgi:hypothetical protein
MESKKKVTLITPSELIAKGLINIFSDLGEFTVEEFLKDISRTSEAILKNIDSDVIILDPMVLDFQSRKEGRNILSEISNAIVVAIEGSTTTDEMMKQYDGSFSIYDEPVNIIRTLRAACQSRQTDQCCENDELSAREKEILICVAKGMQNKEIADLYNISIYTVITHRKNITRKIGIKTIAGLTVYALLNNLIDISSIN